MAEQYPEHERRRAVLARSQAIGEFLDNSGYTLCEWRESPDLEPGHIDWFPSGYYPVRGTIQQILARYFGIHLDKIEREKCDMIKRLREAA